MRRSLVPIVSVLGLAVLLTACVPEPAATPTPGTTSTTDAPPTGLPTASGSPSPSATPSPSDPAAPSDPEPTTAPGETFSTAALANICVTGALESGLPSARADLDGARSEQRPDGVWAVGVGGTSPDGADVLFLCTVDGGPDDFQLELRAQVDGALDDSWTTRLADVEAGR